MPPKPPQPRNILGQLVHELGETAKEAVNEVIGAFSPLSIFENPKTGQKELMNNSWDQGKGSQNSTPLGFDLFRPKSEDDELARVRSQLNGGGMADQQAFQNVKQGEMQAIQYFQQRDQERAQMFEQERIQKEQERIQAQQSQSYEEPTTKQKGHLGQAPRKASVPTPEQRVDKGSKG